MVSLDSFTFKIIKADKHNAIALVCNNNYKFSLRKDRCTPSKLVWVCAKRKCTCSIHTNVEMTEVLQLSNVNHQHPPLTDEQLKLTHVRSAAKRRSTINLRSKSNMIIQNTFEASVCIDKRHAKRLRRSAYDRLRRNAYDQRRKLASLQEFAPEMICEQMSVLPSILVETAHDPAAEATNDTAVEAGHYPAVETAHDPAVEAAHKPAVKAAHDPAVEAAHKPAVKAAHDPAVEATCAPAAHVYDQHFGVGLLDNVFRYTQPSLESSTIPELAGYIRPHRYIESERSGVSSMIREHSTFKVTLDVLQFKPEEISVKVIDNCLIVEGRHEERQDDHGFVARQFTRRYIIPEDVDLDHLKSSLSSDGVLAIHAPMKVIEIPKTRDIPIIQTNQPAILKMEINNISAAYIKVEP